MASYELWQMRTRNLIGTFATKAEALATVRQATDLHGPEFLDTIFLGHEDDKGHSRMIAEGRKLLELARGGKGERLPTMKRAAESNP
jgi:hypothetical protein